MVSILWISLVSGAFPHLRQPSATPSYLGFSHHEIQQLRYFCTGSEKRLVIFSCNLSRPSKAANLIHRQTSRQAQDSLLGGLGAKTDEAYAPAHFSQAAAHCRAQKSAEASASVGVSPLLLGQDEAWTLGQPACAKSWRVLLLFQFPFRAHTHFVHVHPSRRAHDVRVSGLPPIRGAQHQTRDTYTGAPEF